MPHIFEVKSQVISQEKVGPKCYRLILSALEISANAEPGQFVNIACGTHERLDPLLRRPLTIYRSAADHGTIEVIYEVKGNGTKALSQKRSGDWLEVLGPLGKGFVVKGNAAKAILISGGLGVAGLMALAQEIIINNQAKGLPSVYVLIGAHDQSELICTEDFRALGSGIKVIPWLTRVGLETALERLVGEVTAEGVTLGACSVYACGSWPMLKRVSEWAQRFDMACQVSLEAHMACGLGACQSCVCKVKSGPPESGSSGYTYGLVCKDGPVFDAEEIEWGE